MKMQMEALNEEQKENLQRLEREAKKIGEQDSKETR